MKCYHKIYSTNNIGFESLNDYHIISDKTLDIITNECENFFDLINDDKFDYKTASGVLNISFPNIGTFVINKQAPNEQIWLSSPISGPNRFDYNKNDNKWVSSRNNNQTLKELLEHEFSNIMKHDIQFPEQF